jgi:hypothetical protein
MQQNTTRMIQNANIQESLSVNRNIFTNSYFNYAVEGNSNFHIDIHPLFGYKNVKKYVYSYGFYIANLYLYENFKRNTKIHQQKNFDNTMKELIIYYIVFEKYDIEYINSLNQQIKEDLRKLIKLNKCIKIYSPKFHGHLDKKLDIQYEFELETDLQNCFLVVCNTYSTIFLLAYEYNVNVLCMKTDIYEIYPFFVNEKNLLSNKDVNFEICCYKLFLNFFTFDDLLSFGFSVLENSLINEMFKTMKSTINHIKESTKSLSIYIHPNTKNIYNILRIGVKNSTFNLGIEQHEDTLICFYVSENKVSKTLLKGKKMNIIAFDNNVFRMNTTNVVYFRYYVNEFNTQSVPQNNNKDLFFYNSKFNHVMDGTILCILDNSNGLFYNDFMEWRCIWEKYFRFLKNNFSNRILIKVHTNDQNEHVYDLCKKYNFELTNESLDDVLKQPLYFSVIHNGSSYIKCLQHGVLLLSFSDKEDRCVYNLFSNINHAYKLYMKQRERNFNTQLDCVVSIDNIMNGSFFNKIKLLQ